VLHVGQFENVLGEERYAARLKPMIKKLDDHWNFLGILDDHELSAFYQLCELTVLPSTNSTESFGIVQVESMVSGTPVVASKLPGVRQPVLMTGMGLLVSPADAQSLSDGIKKILEQPKRYQGDVKDVINRFSSQHIAEEYEGLFQRLVSSRRSGKKQ
jgi:glycosyltransferase involved in cell wall biosynthesis